MANHKADRQVLEVAAQKGFPTLEQRRRAEVAAGRPNDHRKNIINSNEAAQRYGGVIIEPVITSDEAAQRYGGVIIEPVITSDEAAKRYAGVVIGSTTIRSDKAVQPYGRTLIPDRQGDRNHRRT